MANLNNWQTKYKAGGYGGQLKQAHVRVWNMESAGYIVISIKLDYMWIEPQNHNGVLLLLEFFWGWIILSLFCCY